MSDPETRIWRRSGRPIAIANPPYPRSVLEVQGSVGEYRGTRGSIGTPRIPHFPNLSHIPRSASQLAMLDGQAYTQHHVFRVSVDFGTTFFAMSFTHVRLTKDAEQNVTENKVSLRDTRHVDFGDGKTSEIANVCAYFPDPVPDSMGQVDGSAGPPQLEQPPYLHFGPAITEAVTRKRIVESDVIRFLKIALSEENGDDVTAIRNRVQRQIRGLPQRKHGSGNDFRETTEVDVIADFLWALWKHAEKQIVSRYRSYSTTIPFTRWPIEFVMCVPSTWSNSPNQKMIEASEMGLLREDNSISDTNGLKGPRTIELISEPTAAIAYILGDNVEGDFSNDASKLGVGKVRSRIGMP